MSPFFLIILLALVATDGRADRHRRPISCPEAIANAAAESAVPSFIPGYAGPAATNDRNPQQVQIERIQATYDALLNGSPSAFSLALADTPVLRRWQYLVQDACFSLGVLDGSPHGSEPRDMISPALVLPDENGCPILAFNTYWWEQDPNLTFVQYTSFGYVARRLARLKLVEFLAASLNRNRKHNWAFEGEFPFIYQIYAHIASEQIRLLTYLAWRERYPEMRTESLEKAQLKYGESPYQYLAGSARSYIERHTRDPRKASPEFVAAILDFPLPESWPVPEFPRP